MFADQRYLLNQRILFRFRWLFLLAYLLFRLLFLRLTHRDGRRWVRFQTEGFRYGRLETIGALSVHLEKSKNLTVEDDALELAEEVDSWSQVQAQRPLAHALLWLGLNKAVLFDHGLHFSGVAGKLLNIQLIWP